MYVLMTIREFSNVCDIMAIPNVLIVYYMTVNHYGPLASVMYVKMATTTGALIANQ